MKEFEWRMMYDQIELFKETAETLCREHWRGVKVESGQIMKIYYQTVRVDNESWNSASDPTEEREGVDSKDFFKR